MIDFGKDEIITIDQQKDIKQFDRAVKKAWNLGLLGSSKEGKKPLINNKMHLRKLLKEGTIDKKFIEDLDIDISQNSRNIKMVNVNVPGKNNIHTSPTSPKSKVTCNASKK